MIFDDDEDDGVAVATPVVSKKFAAPTERIAKPVRYFTDAELRCAALRETLIYDTECYGNYWLAAFKSVESGRVVYLEESPDSDLDRAKLEWILWNFKIVTFNGKKYDILMTTLAIAGFSTAQLKEVSDRIIKHEERHEELAEEYGVYIPPINHIDVIEVCPLQGSLKTYAARLHAQRMQELPYDPAKMLTREEAFNVRMYCINDLDNTGLIYNELGAQIALRESLGREYDQDLRSRSDAQIAEHVISAEVAKITGRTPKRAEVQAGKKFQYVPPAYLTYQTPVLQNLLNKIVSLDFEVTAKGKVVMEALKGLDIQIGETVYRLGKGGLHSKEKTAAHIAGNGVRIYDDDVESYYPKLILNSGLYPKNMGPVFLQVFEALVNRRLAAKKAKDKITSDALKITINGTFGKLGSRWSRMYAPELLIQVTLTGQLALLMLIESLELAGFEVISANTDGIVKKCNESRYEEMMSIIKDWERRTGLKTEQTEYSALYSRDINNYIAVKTPDKDGKVSIKGKGKFSNPWNDPETAIFRFHKNPEVTICVEAVYEYVLKGTPLVQTIKTCRDMTKFVAVKKVKGGAEKNGVYLGGVVRWYYARDMHGDIRYVESGNKVPETVGAKPCLDLPESFPDDVDYDWYVGKCMNMLYDLGYLKRPGEQIRFF